MGGMYITLKPNVAKITFRGLRDKPGTAADLIHVLKEEGLSLLALSFDSAIGGIGDVSFIVYESEGERIRKKREEIAERVGAKEIVVDKGLSFLEFFDVLKLEEVFEKFAILGINIEFIAMTSGHLGVAFRRAKLEEVVEMFQAEVVNVY
jgi:aspartokinase